MSGQPVKNVALHTEKNSGTSPNRKGEKLEISELRYRRLFEAAQDGILILDAGTGKITDVNPFLIDLLGYSESELLGKQLWEIGVFKDITESKKAFLELQDKGYIRYKDLPLQTKDGHSVDVEFVSNIYKVGDQNVIQCNIRDISARKKAEEAVESRTKELEELSKTQEETKKAVLNVMEDLEEAKATIEFEKAKDEAMLASIGEGLIAVDNDRKIMVVNKAALDMLGWKTDVVGKDITIFSLEDKAGHPLPFSKRPINLALSTGKTTNGTFFYVKESTRRLPIATNVTPIKMGGKIIGALSVFRDITREKEIDRAKSEFVSLASHQLRTPLGISKWYLEALQGQGFDDVSKQTKEYLAEIYKSNERLLALVRALLSVSRIDQGTVRDAPKTVNITELIKDVVKELTIMAAKKSISILLEFKKEKIPILFIDPLRLQQVIENLVANAIEYSDTGSKIEIIVGKKNEMVLISVKDQGIGISKSDQAKLFTKFFRTAKATTKNTEGAGLGLYVVKSYIKGWGGELLVDSAEGKGSTFTITLPIKPKKISRNLNNFGQGSIL